MVIIASTLNHAWLFSTPAFNSLKFPRYHPYALIPQNNIKENNNRIWDHLCFHSLEIGVVTEHRALTMVSVLTV